MIPLAMTSQRSPPHRVREFQNQSEREESHSVLDLTFDINI